MDFSAITFPATIKSVTTHKLDITKVLVITCTTETGTLLKFTISDEKMKELLNAKCVNVKITMRIHDLALLRLEMDDATIDIFDSRTN